MCGIAGAFGHLADEVIQPMTRALAHRGPDGEGFWRAPSDPLHFGHRRLSILDHAGGFQPMTTFAPDLTITYNGEIYNHASLRSELESAGHTFQSSHSDTEVLLRAYAEWGTDLFYKLNGMWAFGLYDVTCRRLVLGRDRFGQKPLYYSYGPGWFAFASELTSLLQHRLVDASVSNEALLKFHAYGYIPAPHCYATGARKLPAGHWLSFNLETQVVEIRRYWSYELEPDEALCHQPEKEIEEAFRSHLRDAVDIRLLADVPVGVFLSGGIDSTAVTAMARRCRPDQSLLSFSIGFDDPSFDESRYARLASEALGTRHITENCSLDAARKRLPYWLGKLDEPMGDPSLLPTALVSEIASRHVKVVLGGDGADELLCGYDPFRALAPARLATALLPQSLLGLLAGLMNHLPVSHRNMSLDFKLKRALRGLRQPAPLWAAQWMAPMGIEDLAALFGRRLDPLEVYSEAVHAWGEGFSRAGHIGGLIQFFVRLYLQDSILPKVDRAAMWHGLEPRSPFLDIRLVDFVRRLPMAMLYHRGQSKRILRRSLRDDLPAVVLKRPKKGFGIPVGAWFRNGSLPAPHTAEITGLNPAVAGRIVQRHLNGKSDEKNVLWNFTVARNWRSPFL